MPNTIIHKGGGAPVPILFDHVASNDSTFQPQLANASDNGLSLYQPEFLIEDLWALELLEPEDRQEVLCDLGIDEDAILLSTDRYYDASFERMHGHASESSELLVATEHHYGEGSIPVIEAFVDLSEASAIEKQMIEIKNVPDEVEEPKKGWFKRLASFLGRRS